MTSSLRWSSGRRFGAVAAVSSLLMLTAGPASAAKGAAHTTISAHLSASTVLVKTTATVSGTVTPAGGTVALQRLVDSTWTTVAHAKATRTGAFVLSVRAAKSAASWSLKVVRAATSAAKAGASTTLRLHAVTKQFIVAAAAGAVTAPAATVVTGVIAPSAGGSVLVQRLTGKTWIAVATGKLGAGGAFSATAVLPAGADQLRVVKAFTATIAQGVSAAFTATVTPPAVGSTAGAPTITTAALAAARVGVPYAALLTATGGSGFYSWAASGLPAGLTLSTGGLLAGTPTSPGSASIAVTVTDSAGHSAGSTLPLTTALPAGRLFAVGNNSSGQVGDGTMTTAAGFTPVQGMTSVVAAASSISASYAVKADGTVWAWGDNTYGQLGNGTANPSLVPLKVPSLAGVTAVAAGEQSAYALKADGTVWAWGSNGQGEIGDGTNVAQLTPVLVSGLSSIVAIASTNLTAYALRSDGTVWSWGAGPSGELGDGSRVNRSSPVQVSGLTGIKAIASGYQNGYAVRSDGTVAAWGIDDADELGDGSPAALSATPITVPGLSQVSQVAGGENAAYAVTTTGTVFGWGSPGGYDLASPSNTPTAAVVIATTPGALAVAGGSGAGYALLADHTVAAWGRNDSGQCGTGAVSANVTTATAMRGVTGVLAVAGGGHSATALLIAD